MMVHSSALALALGAVVLAGSSSSALGAATCQPSTWIAGHDFKNMQYSHVNGTSAADCCAKCAKYSDKTIGQCKFFTFDGKSTCWMKSNSKGYRTASKDCICGAVGDWKPPVPPPPPPPAPPPLPKPVLPAPKKWDGKPVQVYIMMGQSNMLGEGQVLGYQNNTLESAVFKQGKFPWLKNGDTWSIDGDIRNVFIMASGNQTFAESRLNHNEWLTPDYAVGDPSDGEAQLGARATGKPGGTLGPEFGIANFGGSFKQDNVMLLKSCIGNRALGYDILPPGTARHDYTDASGTAWTYAGYGDSAMKWLKNGAKLRLGFNFHVMCSVSYLSLN